MKRNQSKYLATVVSISLLLSLGACADDNPLDRSKSVVISEASIPNAFDNWLEHNVLDPYNIDLRYKVKDNETSMTYHLAPADYNKSIQMAHLIKYLCLETYDEATGSQSFVRTLFPKIVDLIGSPAYNTNGTMVLGTAEGGRKMTLYNVNNLDPTDTEAMNHYYFKTVHHEFGHIQNQTKAYPKEFQQITPAGYVSDSWSKKWNVPKNTLEKSLTALKSVHPKGVEIADLEDEANKLSKKKPLKAADKERLATIQTLIEQLVAKPGYEDDYKLYNLRRWVMRSLGSSGINALQAGFISTYASSQDREDFVEVQSIFMTDDPDVWEAKMFIAGDTGAALIKEKYTIVESYLKSEWGLSLTQLRDIVQARQARLKQVNLNDLTVTK